jgi:glutamate racemase
MASEARVVDSRPIGIFDSGVGGLTVVRSIIDELPGESIVYYGDTARCPYGPRPLDEIRGFAVGIAEHLVLRDVKLLVVACNSSTAAALDEIRAAVRVPVAAVIEPAVRAALRATRNGRIGLIGTQATVASGAYQRAVAGSGAGPDVQVVARACPLFVEFVERGDTTSPELMAAAEGYLRPLQRAGVDTVILGCTHYPLLRGALHHVMGPDVLLISSADETASDVYEMLSSQGMLREEAGPPVHRFECSGDPEVFATLGRRFLGPEFLDAERVEPSLAGSAE